MSVARRSAGRRPVRRPREKVVLDAKAAKLAAFELLAQKAWSRREMLRRLKRRGAPEEVAGAVVGELQSRGYLDDEAFARWWAQARARGRRVGSVRLRQELAARGIPRELAAAAVGAAFEETAEMDRALDAGRRKLPGLLRAGRDRAPARLRDYLLRRGYPAPVVLRVVKTLLAGELPDGAAADDDREV